MDRRDYFMRLLEQAIGVLATIAGQRTSGQPAEAVQSAVHAMDKLLGLRAEDLAFTDPDRIREKLAAGESPETARDKFLIFSALNYEAGLAYDERDIPALAQPAYHLALIFLLHGLESRTGKALPAYAPRVKDLLLRLDGFELPGSTRAMLEAYRDSA